MRYLQETHTWDTHKRYISKRLRARYTHKTYLQESHARPTRMRYTQDAHKTNKRYQHDILTRFYFTLSQDTIQEIHTRGTTWHTYRILFHTFTRYNTRDTYKRYNMTYWQDFISHVHKIHYKRYVQEVHTRGIQTVIHDIPYKRYIQEVFTR